jgi:hypothetical protein
MGNKSLNVNRDEFVASIWPEVDYSLFDRIECSEEWGENVDRLDSMFKKGYPCGIQPVSRLRRLPLQSGVRDRNKRRRDPTGL